MMKLELKPDFEDRENKVFYQAEHAGCSKDGHLAWVYSGPLLEVFLSESHDIVATWRFGKILQDNHTKISCVTDFMYQGGHMLLVATSNMSEQGTLCLFSLVKKKVIRAVEFPQRITSLEVLFSNTRDDVPSWVISRHLHFFCGLVAVGTKGSYVYLTDLCLDELMVSHTTEAEPKKLSVTGGNIVDPRAKRDRARSHGKHLALLLDDQCHRTGEFYYRRQDDSIQKVFDEADVHVTSLKYLSQAGILAIGFNFGCFQMWRLHGPALDYSSRYKPDCAAISRFLLHEPENDPRKLLYLWIANDNSILTKEEEDERIDSIATISLYQLCFAKKDYYPNFGLFYEDLESVFFWMEHSLSLDPYSSETRGIWSSQLINAYTICNPLYAPSAQQANDSFEEGLHSHDQSLSLFVWRVDSKQGNNTSHYWMAIFDLNRWYHAQMPHGIRCSGNAPQVCSFWAVYKLDDVASCSSPPAILDVHVSGNNVVKFRSLSSLPPLEHSYPSALELMGVKFVTSQSIIRGQCHGWQGQLLKKLAHDGANYLIQPADIFHQCLRARLVPQHFDTETALSTDRKRHALLNLSLDYSMTPALIHQCVELWADGEYVQMGCSLKFLLDWAWNCVVKIKERLDSTCEPLFDWSGEQVSSHMRWNLQRQYHSLSKLNQVFTIFLSLTSPLTETGELELELRQETIKLLLQHYEVVLWCVSRTLLPEIEEGSAHRPGIFEYPVGELCEAYQKRRQEMTRLQSVVADSPLLLIDGLVSCEGDQISSLWESRGGNGLYPPPSMQAVVYMFLLEDISMEVKQAILLYLLQDLVALCDEHSENLVASFLKRFMIAPNLVHKVQGIWFLDHRDYEEGLRQLISPNTCHQEWTSWMDVAVVNTLLAQDEARTATCFVHSGHRLGETLGEQKLMISVLARNGNVSQAVEFMRRWNASSGKLMCHLLKECHEMKLIGQLLQLHFKPQEEVHIEEYMRERTEPNSLEPLFLYYLHRARFVQAFQLHEEMNRMDRLEASIAAHERSADRNRLMDAYLKVLPDITRKLIVEKQNKASATTVHRIRVSQPTPLSTVIHKQNQKVMSRAGFVLALMDKVEEAMQVVEDQLEEAAEEHADQIDRDQSDAEFLKTPLTPRRKSLISRSPANASQPSEVMEARLPANPLSAAKQRTLAGEETEGYKSLHALTMECLTVLKTPSRERGAYQSPKLPGLASGQKKTPQSILKVKRFRASLSRDSTGISPGKLISPSSRPKRLEFSAHKTPSAATPKHLRFYGLSPSPSPSPAVVSEEDVSDEIWTDALEDSPKKSAVEVESQVKEPSDQEEMDVTNADNQTQKNVTAESNLLVEKPGLDSGSPDRYDEAIGDLVRPDLLSPWKQDLSNEDAANEVAMDEDDGEVTFNLSRQMQGESSASKEREEIASISTDREPLTYSRESIPTTETVKSPLSLKIASSSPFTTSSRSSYLKISASETSLGKVHTESVTQTTEYKSVSQTLSIDTTHDTSPTQIVLTPKKRKHSQSPPATPPSSKMAKLAEANRFPKRQLSGDEVGDGFELEIISETKTDSREGVLTGKNEPGTEADQGVRRSQKRLSRTPDRQAKRLKDNQNDGDQSSTRQLRGQRLSRTPERALRSNKEGETVEQIDGDQSSMLQLRGQRLSRTPERALRIKKGGETVEQIDEDQLSTLQVRSQRLSRTPERASRSKRGGDIVEQNDGDQSSTHQLRSQRLSRTPERALRSMKESETVLPVPSEKAIEVSGEENEKSRHMEDTKAPQTSKDTDLSADNVQGSVDIGVEEETIQRRSRRLSRTPERAIKKVVKGEKIPSQKDDETPAPLKLEKAVEKSIGESEEVSRTESQIIKRPSQTSDDADIQESIEVTQEMTTRRRHGPSRTPERAVSQKGKEEKIESQKEQDVEEVITTRRQSSRQSKTPERANKRKRKEEQDEEEVIVMTRQSTRQSKTPERAIKEKVHEEKILSQEQEVEEVIMTTRQSTRQSKTPERAIKKKIHEEKILSQEEQDVEEVIVTTRQSTRQSKTPERAIKKKIHEERTLSQEGQDVEEVIITTRHSSRQSKTPERAVKQKGKEEKIPAQNEHDVEEGIMNTRHSLRRSKTPERFVKPFVHESQHLSETITEKELSSQKDDDTSLSLKPEKAIVKISREKSEESSGTESQTATKPSRTSDDTDASADNAHESVDGGEEMTVRRSGRLSKTPERAIKRKLQEKRTQSQKEQRVEETVSPTRHASRLSKTPDRYVKDFVRESQHLSKIPERAESSQKDGETTLPVKPEKAVEISAGVESDSKSEKDTESFQPSEDFYFFAENFQESDDEGEEEMTLRRSRRLSKTPERTIKKVAKEKISPSRKEREGQEGLSPTRHSTRQSKTPERFVKDFVRGKSASKTDQSKVGVHQAKQSTIPEQQEPQPEASTSASEEPPGSSLSETEGSATVDTGATSEPSSADRRKAVPRRKKKLYHYSPKLLSPLTESEAGRIIRTRTRKQSLQANTTTTSVQRRYSRGPGPLTRRVRPSSQS